MGILKLTYYILKFQKLKGRYVSGYNRKHFSGDRAFASLRWYTLIQFQASSDSHFLGTCDNPNSAEHTRRLLSGTGTGTGSHTETERQNFLSSTKQMLPPQIL